jgi:hypothetical protein
VKGTCFCGAVRFDADPAEWESHACHCESCRRWTGSAFLAVKVPEAGLRWEGAESIRVIRSSDWAERGWCDRCGSTLFYRLVIEGPQRGDHYLAVGLFDEPGAFPLTSELYIDRKPASFAFAGERKRITKAEVEASFADDA